MRRALVALAAVVVAAGAAGCGLPSNRTPEDIDPSAVPSQLIASDNASLQPAAQGQPTMVFFVHGDRLVGRSRKTTVDNIAADSVRALLMGPTTEETGDGLASAIPADTRLISLDLDGATAAVDLSTEFGAVGGSQQVLAVAQIVYTLTGSEPIERVRFAIEGRPIEVPDGSGSLSTAPRGRSDYPQQAPG